MQITISIDITKEDVEALMCGNKLTDEQYGFFLWALEKEVVEGRFCVDEFNNSEYEKTSVIYNCLFDADICTEEEIEQYKSKTQL